MACRSPPARAGAGGTLRIGGFSPKILLNTVLIGIRNLDEREKDRP